jgi:cellobiose transport system substrate-binding protein
MIIAIIVAGCSSTTSGNQTSDGESGNSKGKTTLTMWYWNGSFNDELLAQVNKQFPNIELKPQKIGGDFKAKLSTALAAKSGAPDIIALNDWVAEFLPNKDQFYNLLDYGAADIEKDYFDWKWHQALTSDNNYLIALPLDTGPTALFYRQDLFEKVGLPTEPEEVTKQLSTWEAYLEAGQKLKTLDGVKLSDNINNVFNQVLGQGDLMYFDADDQFIGDQAHVKKAWDLAVAAHQSGMIANIAGWTPEWNAAINNGDISSFVGAVWMKGALRDGGPDTAGKWRIARAPGGDGNNGGSFVGIPKQSKHPEEAYQVIKWLNTPENQLTAYVKSNLYPSTPSILNDPKMGGPEDFFGGQVTNTIFSESAKNVKVAYRGPKFSTVHTIFDQELTNIAKQSKDPEQAWSDAIDKIKKELGR